MSNVYINLPCSSGTANGAQTAIAGLARKKTCIVTGLTGGVVNLQGSDDGGTSWVTLISVTQNGSYMVDAAYALMRCASVAVVGTVTVDLGGVTNLVTDVDLNVPAGNGNGTDGNTSQLGTDMTLDVAGTFESSVILQGSNDAGTSWADVMVVTSPGSWNFTGPFSRMRVRLQGYVSGTPVVSVGSSIKDAIAPSMIDVANASGMGTLIVVRQAITAGTPGSPDDVTLFNASFPFAARLIDAMMYVSTNIGGSTCTLRTASGGGGTALSDAFNTATTGIKRDTALTATPTLAANDSIFLRRSDAGVAGEIVMYFEKI